MRYDLNTDNQILFFQFLGGPSQFCSWSKGCLKSLGQLTSVRGPISYIPHFMAHNHFSGGGFSLPGVGSQALIFFNPFLISLTEQRENKAN